MNMHRPNILWICTDQQRADTIGILGNPYIKTPNLDTLVNNGVAFTNAFCQNPLCQPSRSSFLTGRYPRTTGVRQNGQEYFPDHETLITKTLSENGYTCGLIGKLHIAAACGRIEKRTDDGYSEFHWSHHPNPNPEWEEVHAYSKWLKDKDVNWKDIYNPEFSILERYQGVPEEYHQTTWCIDRAIDFIERNRDPWCLSINIFDPHHPFNPPQEYMNLYDPKTIPEPSYLEGELDNKPFAQQIDHQGAYGGNNQKLPFASTTPDQRKEVTAAYYAMITLIDKQIGRLIEFLKSKALLENTLIIFMSDHGELLGDHGIYLKGPHFYDCSVKVPLIMSLPSQFKNNLISNALVELVDIVPTIYNLVKLPIPERIQGKSLFNLCSGTCSPDYHRDSVYCEYYNTHTLYDNKKVYATMYRDTQNKIVVYHGETEGELYDLKQDPQEFYNLWNDIDSGKIKERLMKKCFDQSVFIMDPCPNRVTTW